MDGHILNFRQRLGLTKNPPFRNHAYGPVHLCKWLCMCIYLRVVAKCSVPLCMCVCVCMGVHVYVRVCVRTHTRVVICVCECVC